MSQNGHHTINEASPDPNYRDEIIQSALKILESRVDELKSDIGVSKSMIPLKVDTDLIVGLKKLLSNPLSQLVPAKKNLDETIGGLIKEVVKKYFLLQNDKVQKAVIIENGRNTHELYFGIVLKEDNSENRRNIYNFLTDYKETNLWEIFPIYFQVYPSAIAEKLNQKEVIVDN
jgi:hypothetical protein